LPFTALAAPDRDAIVEQVLAAARNGSRCVLAIRADYFGHLAAHPELARLISANTVLVGAMSPNELRAAIVRPAEHAGLELDDGLVDALVAEVAAEPGALPLLSTALLTLWERRERRRLTLLAYGQAGGVRAAIGRLAESAYRELGPARQAIARRILLRLADAGGGGEYVRRRTPIAELVPDGDPDARAVLDALAGARLVSVAEGHAEVAHEALLREWPRLRAWLDEDEIGRRVRAHLAPAAAEWVARGRDPAELYRGARLTAALEWAGDHDKDLSPTEREFLAAGRARAQAEVVRRRRSIRRLRPLAAAMAVLLVLAGVATGVAASQRARAGEAALAADVRSLRAQAAGTDHWDLALLYAAQAYRLDPSLRSWEALFATLQRSPEAIGVIRLDSRPLHLAVSPDGTRLAAGDRGGAVYVWDAASRHRQIKVNVSGDGLESIDFSPDGRRLAVVTARRADDGQSNISIIDLNSDHPIAAALPGPDVAGAAFAADGATLVAFTVDGRLAYLDARTGRVLRTAAGSPGPGLAIKLAPGRRFAGAGMPPGPGSGPVSVWDLESNRKIWSGSGWGLAAPSPDGQIAIVATGQRTLQEVNLTTGERRTLPSAHSDAVRDIGWSPDGTTFATASDDRTTVLWDRATLTPKATLVGHQSRVTRAAFVPDGRTLYTTGLDGTVFVWDLEGSRRVARPVGQPPSVDAGDAVRRISSDSSLAATLPFDGQGRLEVTDLTGGDRYVLIGPDYADGFDLSVDANGDRIAFLTRNRESRSGYARVVDVAARRLLPFAVRVDEAAADGREHAGLAISPDGRILTVIAGSGGVQTWNIDRQTRIGDVRPDLSGIATWVSLDPTGHLMASLVLRPPDDAEASIDVVDLRDGRSVAQLERIEDSYQDQPVFSPDGRLLAAGTMSGEILLWDARTWKRLHRWRVSDGWTISVGFTPDSHYVVSGGTDGKAGLWDVRDPAHSGFIIDATRSGANYVYVGTSLHGRELVTVPQFGTPLRWYIDPDSLARRACDIVRRSLTAEEWAAVHPFRWQRLVGGRSLARCLLLIVHEPAHRLGEQLRRGVRHEVRLSRPHHASHLRQCVGERIHGGRHRRPGVAALHEQNGHVGARPPIGIQRVCGHRLEVVQASHRLRNSGGFLRRVVRGGTGFGERSDDRLRDAGDLLGEQACRSGDVAGLDKFAKGVKHGRRLRAGSKQWRFEQRHRTDAGVAGTCRVQRDRSAVGRPHHVRRPAGLGEDCLDIGDIVRVRLRALTTVARRVSAARIEPQLKIVVQQRHDRLPGVESARRPVHQHYRRPSPRLARHQPSPVRCCE
jgi:WD40 repeat protein